MTNTMLLRFGLGLGVTAAAVIGGCKTTVVSGADGGGGGTVATSMGQGGMGVDVGVGGSPSTSSQTSAVGGGPAATRAVAITAALLLHHHNPGSGSVTTGTGVGGSEVTTGTGSGGGSTTATGFFSGSSSMTVTGSGVGGGSVTSVSVTGSSTTGVGGAGGASADPNVVVFLQIGSSDLTCSVPHGSGPCAGPNVWTVSIRIPKGHIFPGSVIDLGVDNSTFSVQGHDPGSSDCWGGGGTYEGGQVTIDAVDADNVTFTVTGSNGDDSPDVSATDGQYVAPRCGF